MRNSYWWVIIVVLLVVIGVLAWLLFTTPASTTTNVTATTTGSVATSTATTTTTGSTTGTSTSTAAKKPTVTSPKSGATVAKIFTVTGQAPGTWYFEAVFPVEVRNPQGAVVGTGQAHAQGDWMTTAMVPFTASVTVTGYSGPATLVLKKDNPSGLPQNDASTTVSIIVQ